MKKAVAILLTITIIAFSFSACSFAPNERITKRNITKTVDVIFNGIKSFDTETVKKYASSSTLNVILTYATKKDQFKQLGKAMFKSLSYEIIEIDKENYSVTLLVKNKDLSEVASDYTESLLKQYPTLLDKLQLAKDITNDEWLDTNLAILTNGIKKAPMHTEETEITIFFEQKNDRLVFQFTTNDEDAISGGALTAIKDCL